MNRRRYIFAAGFALVVLGVTFALLSSRRPPLSVPFAHTTFGIDGHQVPLDGRKLTVVSGPTPGDLNGDGVRDAGLLLAYQPGGSGTFIYVAAVMDIGGTQQGTNAVLLGDRVAPEGVAVSNGMIVASYKDRRADQPMSAAPTVETEKYIRVENGTLSAMPKP